MTAKRGFVFFISLLFAAGASASTDSSRALKAYGPGGPHHVLQECAKIYFQKHGVEVEIIKGKPHRLEERLPLDGDLYFGGAEYMLEDFDQANPGVIDLSTKENLYARQIGIIVRKGNPLNIQRVEDLRREGLEILDVKLEKMRSFHLEPGEDLGNIRHHAYTGRQGLKTWLSTPEIDAWITYKSWYYSLSAHTEFVGIESEDAYRHTPVAVTHGTPYREEAMNFIRFLKSEEARLIFEQHGWN